MKVTEQKKDGTLELGFTGRLDAQGAKGLEHDLDDCMRRGEHHILLNLEETDFISSAGIRILLIFYKKLSAIDGSFNVKVPDRGNVREILELSGLTMLILDGLQPSGGQSKGHESFSKEQMCFEIMDRPGGEFSAHVIGSSEKLVKGTFGPGDSEALTLSRDSMAIGIGALGNCFDDCRAQFGEFMALGGVALTRSPGSTEVDYNSCEDKVVPAGCMLCGLSLKGSFQTIFRFAPGEKEHAMPLSRLCRVALELAESDLVVIAAAVEVAEIVGVALAKSPVEKSAEENIFAFPGIRDWLSFTGEPVYKRSSALLVGVAATDRHRLGGDFLRALGDDVYGMFKAALFSYAPISRDQKDLSVITRDVMERHRLVDLLHLINDQRELLGVGQSRFLRGNVWLGKMGEQA